MAAVALSSAAHDLACPPRSTRCAAPQARPCSASAERRRSGTARAGASAMRPPRSRRTPRRSRRPPARVRRAIASKRSSLMRLPVGLFGLAMNTTFGRTMSMAFFIPATSRSHSPSSGTSTTRNPCARAVTRYITNVGVGDNDRRLRDAFSRACAQRVKRSAMISSDPDPTTSRSGRRARAQRDRLLELRARASG